MSGKGRREVDCISEKVVIRGDLTTGGDLELYGIVEGNLNVEGRLRIFDCAVVVGDVTAESVDHYGNIRGNLYCNETVTAKGGAIIVGDLHARALSVDEHAVVQGEIRLGDFPKKKSSDERSERHILRSVPTGRESEVSDTDGVEAVKRIDSIPDQSEKKRIEESGKMSEARHFY